jgi:hypothetical protein
LQKIFFRRVQCPLVEETFWHVEQTQASIILELRFEPLR